MKITYFLSCVIAGVSLNMAATAGAKIDTSKLSIVKENHANLTVGGVQYKLDSYIKPFQQPYYIVITRSDNAAITHKVAVSVSTGYIKTRGCTESLKRRSDLDKHNDSKTQWLIGVEC